MPPPVKRSEEHTSELQSRFDLVCRLLLEKKKLRPRRRTRARRRGNGPIQKAKTARTRMTFSFFFNDTATTEIYTLSLHDALPIFDRGRVVLCGAISSYNDRHKPPGPS